jgi:hypothetical protein
MFFTKALELFLCRLDFGNRPEADIPRLSVQRAENRPAFKLKDVSICGEAMLIADPQRWQEMEDEHVVSRVIKNIN